MRILILGGDGMLGHQLFSYLRCFHDVRVTLRQPIAAYSRYGMFSRSNSYGDVEAHDFKRLTRVCAAYAPTAVINAIGIVKQRAEAKDAIKSIEINSLFPHRLALLCAEIGARLIHVSTDCVFSGKKGCYSEHDTPDAEDIYGRSKLLGETTSSGCLTLRTSIIGRELSRRAGLLEWFLAQKGTVRGYRKAIFSGFTTIEIARVMRRLVEQHGGASGLYHLSSDPISKYDLLLLIRDQFGLKTRVIPDDEVHCDRSLDSAKFRDSFSYNPPSWPEMVDELAPHKADE